MAQDLQVVPDVDRRRVEVLEEQDRAIEALRREGPRRRLDPHQAVQQPAEQVALGASRAPALPGRESRQATGGLGRREDATIDVDQPRSIALGQLVPLSHAVHEQVGVEGDEPGHGVDRQVQRTDVAHADEHLGVRGDGVVVDDIEVAEREAAADQPPDRADLRVAEEFIELPSDLGGSRGSPPPHLLDVHEWCGSNAEAHRLQLVDAVSVHLQLGGLQRAGERRDGHGVTGCQGVRADDRGRRSIVAHYGATLWFRWKTLVGSQARLSAARRSTLAAP